MTFVKGKSGNPAGKIKGTKNKDTLLKEERRARFDEKISKKWDKIIEELPPTYVADQFMGKAPEEVKVTQKVETPEDKELGDAFNEFLRRKRKGTLEDEALADDGDNGIGDGEVGSVEYPGVDREGENPDGDGGAV
ncbi:MAG: hypothetical protein KGJ90_04175 [Patescibacteria group bacterium]|nr:hypothetical protein [Patescibacteria group bacterium]